MFAFLPELILKEIYKAFHVCKGCENLDKIGLGVKRKGGIIKTLKIYRSGLTPYHFLYALTNDSLRTQKLSSTLVIW